MNRVRKPNRRQVDSFSRMAAVFVRSTGAGKLRVPNERAPVDDLAGDGAADRRPCREHRSISMRIRHRHVGQPEGTDFTGMTHGADKSRPVVARAPMGRAP